MSAQSPVWPRSPQTVRESWPVLVWRLRSARGWRSPAPPPVARPPQLGKGSAWLRRNIEIVCLTTRTVDHAMPDLRRDKGEATVGQPGRMDATITVSYLKGHGSPEDQNDLLTTAGGMPFDGLPRRQSDGPTLEVPRALRNELPRPSVRPRDHARHGETSDQ